MPTWRQPRLRSGLQPIYSSLMTAGAVLLVWQGGERVIAGAMTVGAFVGYLELYLRFINRGFRIPQLVNSIQSGGAAYARLWPLLAPPLPVRGEPAWASFRPGQVAGSGRPAPAPRAAAGGTIAVSLERVTFRYPGAAGAALEELSLEIPPGALVAVTGAVGSGKSALARTLLGLYPLAGGRVLLDGRPLDDVSPAERAARIGYLPQDAYVFSGSVRENVLLSTRAGASGGPEHGGSAAVEQALARAALDDDLRGFSDGLDTPIGELGVRVSGGQRQRIALARALAAAAPARPGLLVLDDPFSAVDVETEARIVAGLRGAFGPRAQPAQRATVVLCSHRLAVFPRADLVLVLNRGRLVEQGTHDELIRAGGLYARIYRAQRRAGGIATELEAVG